MSGLPGQIFAERRLEAGQPERDRRQQEGEARRHVAEHQQPEPASDEERAQVIVPIDRGRRSGGIAMATAIGRAGTATSTKGGRYGAFMMTWMLPESPSGANWRAVRRVA